MSLPVSERGYDAIFTVVDRFSRLVRFIPCHSDITAQQAAALFFEHWVCRFGVPEKIISDRDPRFQSSFWQSLMSALGSRVALSTSYHPQTDGLTERYHRSVEQILRCYCSSQQSSWCTLLSQCEFALNSNVQDSHQLVPFEIVFGRAPTLQLDIHASLQSQHHWRNEILNASRKSMLSEILGGFQSKVYQVMQVLTGGFRQFRMDQTLYQTTTKILEPNYLARFQNTQKKTVLRGINICLIKCIISTHRWIQQTCTMHT